jgi:hypothetical protein
MRVFVHGTVRSLADPAEKLHFGHAQRAFGAGTWNDGPAFLVFECAP